MKRKLPVIISGLIVVLALIAGFLIWQKSQVKPQEPAIPQSASPAIKKVDLASQPEWVQKLSVTAKKGQSPNGLANFTVTVSGMPADLVQAVNYVVQYQTSNKGAQGALSSVPIAVNGATTFTKTIDLGTCSTKSCVRHDGVTSIDVELDFTTSSGESPTWTGTIPL